MENFWNKLKTTIMTAPKEPPSNALPRFTKFWLTVQSILSMPEKHGIPVQQTEIPSRLKAMVDLLVDEESRLDDAGDTGVCMEYLLRNNVLAKLVNTCAEGDHPRGIIGETIRTIASMINLLDDRFLVHNAVHKPTVKLLRTYCAPGSEMEDSEVYHEDLIDLMYVLCSKIHGNPELLNIFFYDKQWLTVPERVARRLQKSRETIALLRSISSRSNLALSNVDFNPPSESTAPNEGVASTETGDQPQTPKGGDTDGSTSKAQDMFAFSESKRDYEFLLFTYLSKFVHREGKAGDFARTGLLFLMELATGSLGEYILESDFATYLTAGVGALYSQLPRKLIVRGAPTNLTYGNSAEAPSASSLEEPKPSRRTNIELSTSPDFQSRLDAFLKVLEFCQEVLMRCPNPGIAANVLASFKAVFLESILYPSILECSDTDGSSVAVISYIDQILQVIEHQALVDLVVGFLMESEDEDDRTKNTQNMDAFAELHNTQTTSPYFTALGRFTLKDLVLSRLKSRSQPTVIATLKLLNTIVTRHCKYSLKLLDIQLENRAITSREQSSGIMDPYGGVPMISHHAHELDLFFALIGTINPFNTQEVFSCGYEAYLRDAEGSVESHKCLSTVKETVEAPQRTGIISDEDRKKQRRRSMKYGQRMDLPDSQMGDGHVHDHEKKTGDCCDNVARMHRLQSSDPLLKMLLGTLSHFFAHSVELNLALTGVVTSLAICPHRSLEGWLFFRTSDVKKPDVDRDSGDESDDEASAMSPQRLVGFDPAHPRTIDLYDSDDEDTMPIFFAPTSGDAIQIPPSFKAFPPFFTMLKTLTQQVDYYRSEIDGFDEYLAEWRRSLLPPPITNINKITRSYSVDQGMLAGNMNNNSGNMFLSNDMLSPAPGDIPGRIASPRPSTPTMFGSSSPRVGDGGNTGTGSRVSSPVPQRSNSMTIHSPIPIAAAASAAAAAAGVTASGGSSAPGQVTAVKIQNRPRKSSSPSSLMSTPSNMSFLSPPGMARKRSFKSNSGSPLAAGNGALGDGALLAPTPRYPSGPSTPTTSASDLENQSARNTSSSSGSILQPRALWPTAAASALLGAGASASKPTPVGGMTTAGSGSAPPGQGVTNAGAQLGSYGHVPFGSVAAANPLAKVINTMKIRPLFADGFLDDSDCEAQSIQQIGANFEDDESEEEEEEEEETDETSKKNSTSLHSEEEHEANSDLREPNRQQPLKQANTVSGSVSTSREIATPPTSVGKKKRKSSSAPQQEKMITLGQLLTNVVILEEMVKEVIAIAQVRKAVGVDTVRFL
ncbi:MAG: Retinoic acid induced 16-like protein-domain-containing protein [Benniella sp.]|nr:MAG: Retinoic acid induced 16-like protein-domain-containing protein [Benniella sp.]